MIELIILALMLGIIYVVGCFILGIVVGIIHLIRTIRNG